MKEGPTPAQTTDPDGALRSFAAARASAGVLRQGPETKFKPGWFPRLAGEFVRNADDPQHGYETRADALAAARRWRAACQEALIHV